MVRKEHRLSGRGVVPGVNSFNSDSWPFAISHTPYALLFGRPKPAKQPLNLDLFILAPRVGELVSLVPLVYLVYLVRLTRKIRETRQTR